MIGDRDSPEEIDPDFFLAYDFSGIEADNQRYRLALESINIGVFEYYPSIDHFEANYIWYQLTGLKRGDGLKGLLANLPAERHQEVLDIFGKSEPGGRLAFTSKYNHPDKGERWISATWFVTSQNGTPQSPLHFSGTLIDITEWKKLEENFVEKETIQNTAFDELPIGLLVIDSASKRIELVNPFGANMLGLPTSEIVGKRCHHFLCPAPEGFCPVCDLGQEISGMERTIIRSDGNIVHVLKSVIRIATGKKEKLLECFFDITNQKKTEEELRSVTDRLTLAARAGGVGIWDLDLLNGMEDWDDQMYRLYSATREEFPRGDMAWQSRIHPDDKDFQNREIERAVAGERNYDSEFRIVWPDGSTHTIRAMAMLQTDRAGKPTHLIGTNWDITKQKETESELIRTNLHLETASIQANRLMVEAESANVAKSAFLATISHEIRTPMNGVIGMAGLLLDTELTPEQRQYAQLLKSSGETLLSLINDVLDFSKMEAKKIQLDDSDFSLPQMISTTVSMMEIHAAGKSLELKSVLDSSVPAVVRGDENRLRQILMNLIGNAIKFTDAGGITVKTGLENETNEHLFVRFAIIDTGIGIPPEKQKQLFMPFTQLDSTSTRRYGGTGLGLAISRQLTELMGGKIGVISDGRTGTIFWFTIRFNQPARSGDDGSDGFLTRTEADRTEAATAEASEDASEEDSPPLEVLLAEDNATNQFIAKKILEKIGCRVDIADNGIEAVNAVKTKRYDLVFMDCQMPEMDGYEATKKIRELKDLPGRDDWIPIIAMTAHALSGDREKCLTAGMDDYLVKPILPDSIAAAIRKWKRKQIAQSHGDRTEIFDRRSFFSRIMNDVALARAVITAFLEDIPAQIELLGKSIEQNDMPSAERFAHRIRGAAANLSCNEISRIARECEIAAHDKKAGETRDSRKRLEESFRSASKILEALL
jgi:PAS domain S-box-containing protein